MILQFCGQFSRLVLISCYKTCSISFELGEGVVNGNQRILWAYVKFLSCSFAVVTLDPGDWRQTVGVIVLLTTQLID